MKDLRARQEWIGESHIARIERTTRCTAIVSSWEPFGHCRRPYTRRYYRDTLEQWLVEPVASKLPTLRELVARLHLVARRRPKGEVQVFAQHPALVRLSDYTVRRVMWGGSVILRHGGRRVARARRLQPRRRIHSLPQTPIQFLLKAVVPAMHLSPSILRWYRSGD